MFRIMKFNEKELAHVAGQKSDREGRLNHKGTSHRDSYHERWFKLKGNLLFYYRLNDYGAVSLGENPEGVYVIENCKIRMEQMADMLFVFSITFIGDNDKKHLFSGPTQNHCEQWVKSLQEASYEHLRFKLQRLQSKLFQMTGKDPLQPYGTSVQLRHSYTRMSEPRSQMPRNRSVPSTMWLVDFELPK